jgi:hypothetical protein
MHNFNALMNRKCTDTRKIRKVQYKGERYLDITDYFLESFFNGDYDEGDRIPSIRRLDKWGGKKDENK